jgi:hypothetical protein
MGMGTVCGIGTKLGIAVNHPSAATPSVVKITSLLQRHHARRTRTQSQVAAQVIQPEEPCHGHWLGRNMGQARVGHGACDAFPA